MTVRPLARRRDLLEAIVLVGGYAEGLLPLTQARPPALMPVVNLALIEHVIEGLKHAGVRHIVLAMHHHAQELIRHFLYRPCGVDLSFVTETLPQGTAGAIRHALPSVRGERCFVMHGDIFTNLNLRGMLSAHLRQGAEISMALAAAPDPRSSRAIETDQTGRVRSIEEQPAGPPCPGREVSAGVFLFERTALDRLPEHPASFERDVLPSLLRQGVTIYGHRVKAFWARLCTPADYLRVHHDILSGKIAVPLNAHEASPGIWLGRDIVLADDALLRAPVLIGDGAHIERGAVVGPFTVLGNNVTVGQHARVRGSLLWNESVVDAQSSVVQCVIGERNRLSGKVHGTIRGDCTATSGAQPNPSSWNIACPVAACVPGFAHLTQPMPSRFQEELF